MGVPVPVTLQGQKVFLCCKGCVKKAQVDPQATLAKVAELKARKKKPAPPPASPPGTAAEAGGSDATVRANLARLSPEDRKVAEAQGYCPIQTDTRLGEMGVPVMVQIKGRKVFLCCKGCKAEALEDPDQTLAQVDRLKARTPHPKGGKQP
jgi:hypothetical protein